MGPVDDEMPISDPAHTPEQRRSRVTIADVAREAGVSTSTASRAISGNGYVAERVRARVVEVARGLGYVPDAMAKGLRHRRSRSVGVLISDLANAFYAEVATGIEQVLREREYHMLVANSDGIPDEELAAARTFVAMRVPGVLVTPVSATVTTFLMDHRVTVVEVDRSMSTHPSDAVLLENEHGAYDATTHLLALGHRRIGLIVGELSWTTGAERMAGYQRALAAAALPADERVVAYASFHPREATRVAGELLDLNPDITAVVATNNVLAEGAIHALRERRLSIPQDISLVAFDDLPWMSLVDPPITTVAQPTLDIGRTAARLLIERLDGKHPMPRTVKRIPARLVVRGSTARRSDPGRRAGLQRASGQRRSAGAAPA